MMLSQLQARLLLQAYQFIDTLSMQQYTWSNLLTCRQLDQALLRVRATQILICCGSWWYFYIIEEFLAENWKQFIGFKRVSWQAVVATSIIMICEALTAWALPRTANKIIVGTVTVTAINMKAIKNAIKFVSLKFWYFIFCIRIARSRVKNINEYRNVTFKAMETEYKSVDLK